MKNKYFICILSILIPVLLLSCSSESDKEDKVLEPVIVSEDNDVSVVLSKDYIEDANTYFLSNGIVIVEKKDSLNGIVIVADSLNLMTGDWSPEKSFVIYCDSLYNPLIAKDSQNYFYFDYEENGDLVGISINDLSGKEVRSKKITTRKRAMTRASTDVRNELEGIGFALDILGIAQAILDPNNNATSAIAAWLLKGFPEIAQDLVALIPSFIEMLKGGKLGLLGTIISYEKLIRDICENRTRSFIGDCTPRISTVLQSDKNSVNLNVQISGVKSNSKDIPYYIVKYWQEVNGEMSRYINYTSPQIATNGNHTVTINNLTGGRYGYQVIIVPGFCLENFMQDYLIKLYNFRSNIVYLDVARLYIKDLAQEDTYYNGNNVIASIKVVLDFASDQDKAILSAYKEYGVYVHYQQEDYYSVKDNDGMEFYINLDIPRNDFYFYDNDFIAVCANKIEFKTYTIDGWGIKNYYDEKKPSVIYDKKPLAITKDVVSTESTSAIIKCQYDNCNFWEAECGVEYFANGEVKNKKVSSQDEQELEIKLSGLLPNTSYTYRAFYETNGEKKYGEEKKFSTEAVLPNVTGTWNCKEYYNDRVISEATFVLHADGTIESSKDILDNTKNGTWSITEEGKVHMGFSYNDAKITKAKNYNGTVNNTTNPSRIEGSASQEWYSYVNGRDGKNYYTFVMTR